MVTSNVHIQSQNFKKYMSLVKDSSSLVWWMGVSDPKYDRILFWDAWVISSPPSPSLPGRRRRYCRTGARELARAWSTGRMWWMAHRKWKESKQQPSMLPGPAVPGCCLFSFHFLWAILCPQAVDERMRVSCNWLHLWATSSSKDADCMPPKLFPPPQSSTPPRIISSRRSIRTGWGKRAWCRRRRCAFEYRRFH